SGRSGETSMNNVPVITIDGPSGSGKGTATAMVAEALKWNVLDSGALYRILALAAEQAGIASTNEASLRTLATKLPVEFAGERILLNDADISRANSNAPVAGCASRISATPGARE